MGAGRGCGLQQVSPVPVQNKRDGGRWEPTLFDDADDADDVVAVSRRAYGTSSRKERMKQQQQQEEQ